MKKLFELNEKDLEMISGGDISKTAGNIIFGAMFGLPEGLPIMAAVQKMSGDTNNLSTSLIVANSITSAVSSVALMGAGAGLLKVWQNLHGKKTNKANSLAKKTC